MSEIDWTKFGVNLRNYLRRKGLEELAGLLAGAKFEHSQHWLDQETPWDTLDVKLLNSFVHRYDAKDAQTLLNATNALIPQLSMDSVRVGSLLDEDDDGESNAIIYDNPTFGSPSKNSKFACDVFVIMPFDKELKPIFDEHIAPAVIELGLDIKRGDDFFSKQSIVADIWAALNACRLVVAECTGRNPNVFYELGIAHTLGKAVVLLTQDINDIPFDLRHLRHIEYKNKLAGASTLKLSLTRAIVELMPPDERYISGEDVKDAGDIPF